MPVAMRYYFTLESLEAGSKRESDIGLKLIASAKRSFIFWYSISDRILTARFQILKGNFDDLADCGSM